MPVVQQARVTVGKALDFRLNLLATAKQLVLPLYIFHRFVYRPRRVCMLHLHFDDSYCCSQYAVRVFPVNFVKVANEYLLHCCCSVSYTHLTLPTILRV